MLCEVRLWDYAEGGYQIHNWADRQEPAWITEKKRSPNGRPLPAPTASDTTARTVDVGRTAVDRLWICQARAR